MPRPTINPRKIVAFTGAGISAPSGISTFRSAGGLWEQHRIEDVATPEGWAKNPELVLQFYNDRRKALSAAAPNESHRCLAALEERFEVVVVTQNVDDLHERAGSTQVAHLHGELRKARSTLDDSMIVDVGYSAIHIGQMCPKGGQLRPHIVWFGEAVMLFDVALQHIMDADKFVVVGSSLTVFPAAALVQFARVDAEKIIIDLDPPPPR
jgi:NAD-dependent deacetylase